MTDKVEIMDILKEAINCDEIIIESEEAEEGVVEETTEEYEIIDIIEEIEEVDEPADQEEDPKTVESEPQKEEKRVAQNGNANGEVRKEKIVEYNVSDDWEDEEMGEVERVDSNSSDLILNQQGKKYGGAKNKRVLAEAAAKSSGESHAKKSRVAASNYEEQSNDGEEVLKSENNLVYTVLESKKPHSNHVVEEDSQHRIEQLEDESIPVEDAIYYDNENENITYVTETGEEGEQYRFNTVMASEQEWDNSQQSIEQPQDEDSEQGQIFLHEDEEGHLYFKDENGTLQPVYLTEDGNYAIASNDSDDLETREQQSDDAQVVVRNNDQEEYILSDKEVLNSSKQDVDSEDNTVTISLIISEDEHGQKRTQVIIPTTENLKCDICHKTFKTSFQLLKHNRLKHAREEDITTRNFPCDLCPKRFPDQNSLARHRKSHTGDRPFQCLECQKTFPTATALRRHLTLHNPQSRPLPCIYCGRRFLEKESLARHEQSHMAGEHRNHVCDICHKSFSQAGELALHKKNHDPDRKFDCEVCGREFNRLNNLQRHMMVHQQQGENEEILSCEVCGITYKFMSSLTRHMVTTHMNPEKMRQQAEEQRRKRETNYRRYLENRKMYETQNAATYVKRSYQRSTRMNDDNDDEV